MLTKVHQGLIKQFIDDKSRSYEIVKLHDDMVEKVKMLEMALAQKTPVMQAEHVIDDTNLFSTFDCLIPKIKEHRRVKLLKDSTFSIADLKT